MNEYNFRAGVDVQVIVCRSVCVWEGGGQGTTLLILARLFSKKTSRYCHSPGVGGVVRKLRHFLISLLLLKIFTRNSDELFTIERGAHTIRGGNPQFLTQSCPFFDLEFSKCSCSRSLAPACGALVNYVLVYF